MSDPTTRALALLALLQSREERSGQELAARLGVTPRTLRRDVERLRAMDYPVEAAPGVAGYRLGAGGHLPPLLLDDEEAVAVVLGLRTTIGSVSGLGEVSLRALGKLEQLLPSRLRHRVGVLQRGVVRAGAVPGPQVAPDVLLSLAESVHRCEGVRFDYTDLRDRHTRRTAEPYAVVNLGRHWYLAAYDTGREDWRTFRVDRMRLRTPGGARFRPRTPPAEDWSGYVEQHVSAGAWAWSATVEVPEPEPVVSAQIWPGMGVVEAVDESSCRVVLGAGSPTDLVWMLTSLDLDFALVDPEPEVAEAVRRLGRRCLAAQA